MKRFGIEFSEPDVETVVEYQKMVKPGFVIHAEQVPDTPFQKGLAYWSYYTLVFATFCALTPDLVRSTLEPVVRLVI